MKNSNNLIDSKCSCPLGAIAILSRKLSKIFRNHFSKIEVTNSQASIFLLLSSKEELPQKSIGETLELEKSTVSRDLVRLVNRGYLYKTKDAKSPNVGLTKKGQEFVKKITCEWEKGYEDAKEYLGEKGMKAISDLESSVIEKK